jgi:hypothetical protein
MKKPLKDVSGTTLALTSLAILGAAAVVSTPVWMYYRRKRKRIDSLAGTPPGAAREADAGEPTAGRSAAAQAQEPAEPTGPPSVEPKE